MKVYRIAMESTCYKSFCGMRQSSLESLYYEMGYLISGNKFKGCANNLYNRISSDDTGFYYFIFLEDAIHFAIYSKKPSAVLKVLEFDFPEDIVYSLIGWGGYHHADGYNYDKRAETYISDSKINGDRITDNDVNQNDKIRTLLSEFRKSILTLKDYYDKNNYIIELADFDEEKLRLIELSDEELLHKYVETKEYSLKSYDIYGAITNPRRPTTLIKTDAITHKSSMFLFSYMDNSRGFEGQELPVIAAYNSDVLAKNGLILDYSKSGLDCRIDYTRMIEKKDYESAKRLLKSYRG